MSSRYPPGSHIPGYAPDHPPVIPYHEQGVFHPSPATFVNPQQYPNGIAPWHNPTQSHQMQPDLRDPAQERERQRGPPTTEQKKHKRTRSGCFTCRTRRVKCDEARPICERCKKGNRDCVYPPPATAKSGSRSNLKAGESRSQGHGSDSSDNEGNDSRGLETIVDDVEGELKEQPQVRSSGTAKQRGNISRKQSTQSLAGKSAKQTARSLTANKEKTGSPSSATTDLQSPTELPEVIAGLPETAALSEDVRFFLAYHHNHVTYNHYFLKPVSEHFVQKSLLEYAMQYEPLLYALIGFSAYHYTIRQPSGKLHTFLRYYNKSVSLLRKSLQAGDKHSRGMLMTILQLATFEEYIGDWVNLVDHHQAAHRMLLELFSVDEVNKVDADRNIFVWYCRFDVIAGLLAGNETRLGREWYVVHEEYHTQEALKAPNDPTIQLALFSAQSRRFAMDMASLFAKLSRGEIPLEEFQVQNEQLTDVIESMRSILQRLHDPQHTVQSYPDKQPLGMDDIVDPYIPGAFYADSLWQLNLGWVDLFPTILMHRFQTCLVSQQDATAEFESLALEEFRLIETIYRWPTKPEGTMIICQSGIALSAMFLPKDHRHMMFARKRLAVVEQNGYIFPTAIRSKFADLWQDPEMLNWWLPNEEGYPQVIKEIRSWVEERTTHPRDNFRGDLRDMKTLFWKMSIDDSSSPGSSGMNPELSPPQRESPGTSTFVAELPPKPQENRP
ncbi:hypothetical protein FQN54_008834 [Arachnomyces sp. PD_36]|nr:hypothetical protein FQN54_008834 [Arachnomyces sp. PD_36]